MCDAYSCNFFAGSECAHRQNYKVKMSAIFPDPIGKGTSNLQMTALHMRVKALQKVYEMWIKIHVWGWRLLVRWLESTRVADGVHLNQLIRIIIIIITVLLTLNTNRPTC